MTEATSPATRIAGLLLHLVLLGAIAATLAGIEPAGWLALALAVVTLGLWALGTGSSTAAPSRTSDSANVSAAAAASAAESKEEAGANMVDVAPPPPETPYQPVVERERAPVRDLLDDLRLGVLRVAFEGARTRQIILLARQNAELQEGMADDIFKSSHESSEALEDIARRTEGISESNRTAVEIARETGSRLDEASDGLNRAHDRVVQFRENVEKLSEASSNIARISGMVKDFSKQTNLLALNAAIEAARAGEAGASFTVVAEQVRDLAGKVSEANAEIGSTLEQMDGLVHGAAQGAEEISSQTGAAQDVLSEATAQFRQLVNDSEANYAELEQIGTAMEELTNTNREIYRRTGEIKNLGELVSKEANDSDTFSRTLRETAERALAELCRVRTGAGPLEELLERRRKTRDRLQGMLQALYDRGVDVFDQQYERVGNTEPPKYRTRYLEAMRQAMQDAIDETVQDFEGAGYSTLVDVNGYLPVHHRWVSHEPTGDPDTDIAKSRHMRLFNAEGMEINRARNTRPFLLQMNLRDTGEVLGDLAMPVYVSGRHWGNVIFGFPVEKLLQID